ncbi:TPA: phage virion morphogenesis protein [Escherichia coli]|nr:phage virion morphogenesis protein [Escherichia coli]
MLTIKVNTQGIERHLNQLLSGIKNRQPLMQALAGDMWDAVEENFKRQGRPAWAGWSPAYAARRGPGQILQRKGRLAASISPDADNDNARVGTNVAYAAIQQLGGTINIPARSQRAYYRQRKDGTVGNRFVRKSRSNYSEWHTLPAYKIEMPARPFLQLADEDISTLEETAQTYLRGLMESGG